MKQTVDALERGFSDICESSYPHEWDEDYISLQLMKKVRE
jgi:hypothetical protein